MRKRLLIAATSLAFTLPANAQKPASIVVVGQLWYFSDSGTPAGYPESTQVEALDASGNQPTANGTYYWLVSGDGNGPGGSSELSFSPDSTVTTATTTQPAVIVYARGPSRSRTSGGVSYQWIPAGGDGGCTSNDVIQGTNLYVDYPAISTNTGTEYYGLASANCNYLAPANATNASNGYANLIYWTVHSGISGIEMPSKFYVNEALYNFNRTMSGSNWGNATPGGGSSGGGGHSNAVFADELCSAYYDGKNPEPTAFTGMADSRVFYESQDWCAAEAVENGNFGSFICHGKHIIHDQQNYYTDQGVISGVSTP